MARTVLLFPPACDPTAPYLSVPLLTGYLRAHGEEVTPVDANAGAMDWLFREARMLTLRDRLEERLQRLERKSQLHHGEQLLYGALWSARAEAHVVPGRVEDAVATLRDPVRFLDPARYAAAVATLDAALRVVGAAYAPLTLTFTGYKTPFSLLNPEEVAADARENRNPFYEYFAGPLLEELRRARPQVVGISVAFPGQLQPAYSLAFILKQALPGVHLTVGGPALTQLFQPLQGERRDPARGPFDSVVLYEGETALLDLVRTVGAGGRPAPFIHGNQVDDLGSLPPPDFSGLPLERYLSPEPVLPYDPTRGCYWGKCAFCHYGLAEVGTARYRERPAEQTVEHVAALAQRHGARVFYFSQDAVNPKTAVKIARGLKARGVAVRWGTDMRPERSLTPELCAELREGGALSMALGVESAAPRVLQLIHKGVDVEVVRGAIDHLAGAGIAVEAMAFTDFPTETAREARATVQFLEEQAARLALFICGEFALTRGSRVAQEPAGFGVAETWSVAGDELGLGFFYREQRDPKTDDEREALDGGLEQLSRRWLLHQYPWAGALSTAHTLLYYAHHGPDCFRRFHRTPVGRVPQEAPLTMGSRFDVQDVAERVATQEAAAWEQMVAVERRVSRARYRELVEGLAPVRPRPGTWRLVCGQAPARASGPAPAGPRRRGGRRPSHAANASRPGRAW